MTTSISAKRHENASYIEYIFCNVYKMPRTHGNKLQDIKVLVSFVISFENELLWYKFITTENNLWFNITGFPNLHIKYAFWILI